MKSDNDYIYEAVSHLEQLTDIKIEFDGNRTEDDKVIKIKNIQFIVYAKSEARKSNKGIILSRINELRHNCNKPIILIVKFLAIEVAKELRTLGINYIDSAGNSYIKENELLIFISGQKIIRPEKTYQSRAFQEAGIKLIFNLLRSPGNLQLTYRELSELTEISIGSVSNVMNELEELNYILRTVNNRILKNTTELLDRWIIAYNDVLRPRILKKRFRFANKEAIHNWKTLQIENIDGATVWGCEPAAAILTKQIQPEKITLYTKENWQNIARDLKLIPDNEWDVEILQMFWNQKENSESHIITPPLLVYADLISSGIDRNMRVAEKIFENELHLGEGRSY